MNKRRIVLLAGAVAAAGAAVVGFATAGQADREREEPSGAVVHEVPAEEAQDAAEYWTEKRMREAQPMPMPEAPENP
ncbi:hypothetical protein [Actinomadura hibisca]|uniref:hypothetical protein n=1 Tax=Actinomadura hibisca TaxID=68565 RepID=UPI00082BB0C9|nr:hypothetical protein [Actinomadura hibisca]